MEWVSVKEMAEVSDREEAETWAADRKELVAVVSVVAAGVGLTVNPLEHLKLNRELECYSNRSRSTPKKHAGIRR
jgi:hypothetical protein